MAHRHIFTHLISVVIATVACVDVPTALMAAEYVPAKELNPPTTSVQMFQWRWNDLNKECTDAIGPTGYGAVQISPPQAAKVVATWWGVYQPVNYASLESKMGTEEELKSMIRACHAAGVRVYADVVFNQMAANSSASYGSTDGSAWDAEELVYPQFQKSDFHEACVIADEDYNSSREHVLNCRLNGMPDLDTSSSHVQGVLADYLKKLLSIGVDGFRIDAAKHQQPEFLRSIISKVKLSYPKTLRGEDIWITQEVIPDGTVDRQSYYQNGTLNEFGFTTALRQAFRNTDGLTPSMLPSVMGANGKGGGTWYLLPSEKATVFVNNWDTERTSVPSLNASNQEVNDITHSRRYDLANIFMLAWPYGEAQVHSGFYFNDKDHDAPTNSPYDINLNPVYGVEWDFVHRWASVGSMVKFRSAADGQEIKNWVIGNTNQIAFSRGSVGFVAINNSTEVWNRGFSTGLAKGDYCNIILLTNSNPKSCTDNKVVVDSGGYATLHIPANNGASVSAVAIYSGSRIDDVVPVPPDTDAGATDDSGSPVSNPDAGGGATSSNTTSTGNGPRGPAYNPKQAIHTLGRKSGG